MNSENELISIIVPVYNAEKTIRQTLIELQNQEYKNIEIVLIDDGSTDASKNICEEIQKRDDRIKLYSIENSGPSYARQYGLDRANGRYIAFCDADDTMEKTMMSTLIDLMHRNECQLSVCLFNRRTDNEMQYSDGNIEVWNQIEAIQHCLADGTVGGFLWNKVFDLRIIKEYNIRFDEQVYYCEDMEFVVEYLLHCKKIVYIRRALYNYIYQEGSLSSGDFSWKKLTNVFARVKILNLLKNTKLHEAIPLAKKELVLQSVYAGRSIEKADALKIENVTDKQFQAITSVITQNCRKYGCGILLNEKCSIKDKINIIRFGFLKKWKRN